MPSCHACRKWFSEEDGGCGCPNETIHMTREMLTKALAEARSQALMEAVVEIRDGIIKCDLHFRCEQAAQRLEAMAEEATNAN